MAHVHNGYLARILKGGTPIMIICFFDTETTGLPKNWDAARLVQLGWILEDGDRREVLSRGNMIVRPEGFEIPEGASAAHGISTERALEVGVDCKRAVYYFLGAARMADFVVGHNVGYDMSVVGSELYRHWGKDYLQGMETRDTMKAGTDLCAIWGPRGV